MTANSQVEGSTAARITLLHSVREDIASVFERDPAAKNWFEVVLCYSGLHALWMYRISHWLWSHGVHTFGRWLSQVARFLTGIEIHPAAQIGHRLFIDHGMGVVIGETAIVGNDVTMYQGVTLGGTGKDKGKRHPTIHSNVVIGGGAKVLGNITVGANCRIGAGSVVLRDVPENSTVVGVPGRIVLQNGKRIVIDDPKEINDPLSQSLCSVMSSLRELQERVYLLESERHPPQNSVCRIDGEMRTEDIRIGSRE